MTGYSKTLFSARLLPVLLLGLLLPDPRERCTNPATGWQLMQKIMLPHSTSILFDLTVAVPAIATRSDTVGGLGRSKSFAERHRQA